MTLPQASQITSQVLLNGNSINPISWSCQLGAYGNINHFEVTTSIAALQNPNSVQTSPTRISRPYDIFADVKSHFNSTIQIYVSGAGVNAGGSAQNQQQLVFTGIVDELEGLWHSDTIEIRGRDTSAILRDEFQAPSDINYNNQPISSVVTQIAQKYGFTPLVTATTQLAGTQYDAYQTQEFTYADRPRPVWRTLQNLAQQCGYIMFVTPRNELYFGPPGTSKKNTFYWKPNQSKASQDPVYELGAVQMSRRSNNFTVNVYAVDHNNNNQSAYATTVVYQGQSFSGASASPNAIAAASGLVYNRHPFGLNTQNAQQLADAIAEDIQRREIVFQATVEGNPLLNVNDMVTFIAANPGELFSLNNQKLVISGLTHSFEMPQYESVDGGGFWTHITATGSIQPADE